MAYINNVVIYSKNWTDHRYLKHISLILECLKNPELIYKPNKCVYAASPFVYLGHVFGNGEVGMDSNKLEVICKFVSLKKKNDVRSFHEYQDTIKN